MIVYTVVMLCHVTFPYEWLECTIPDDCQRIVHYEGSAADLNAYPQKWMEDLLGFTVDELRRSTCEEYNFDVFNCSGHIVYRDEGKIHREDGPAAEHVDVSAPYGGTVEWWANGKRHRVDGPAVIQSDGGQVWYRDGEKHRDGAPAEIMPHYERWYQDGMTHREDGPAVTDAKGNKMWYHLGRKYQAEGPAIYNLSPEVDQILESFFE